MKALRSVLVTLGVAAVAFLASAPFLTLDGWAGFAALAVLALALFTARERIGLRGRLQACRAGVLLALLLLVPARSFAELLVSGFDDGPFTGRPYPGDVSKLRPGERVAYRGGELVVYRRARGAAPVLAYRAGGRTEWAHELFASLGDRGENELWDVSGVRVTSGLLRDRLDFTATWTYGAERGYAFLWRWGEVQKFYLSW